MAMVSMKVDSKDYDMAMPPDNPYGYGLCIYLNEEQVEALGLDKNPPKAGTSVGIRAIATVVSVTQEADPTEEAAEGEDPDDIDVTLRFQITDMEVTPGGQTITGSMLYGGDNG